MGRKLPKLGKAVAATFVPSQLHLHQKVLKVAVLIFALPDQPPQPRITP